MHGSIDSRGGNSSTSGTPVNSVTLVEYLAPLLVILMLIIISIAILTVCVRYTFNLPRIFKLDGVDARGIRKVGVSRINKAIDESDQPKIRIEDETLHKVGINGIGPREKPSPVSRNIPIITVCSAPDLMSDSYVDGMQWEYPLISQYDNATELSPGTLSSTSDASFYISLAEDEEEYHLAREEFLEPDLPIPNVNEPNYPTVTVMTYSTANTSRTLSPRSSVAATMPGERPRSVTSTRSKNGGGGGEGKEEGGEDKLMPLNRTTSLKEDKSRRRIRRLSLQEPLFNPLPKIMSWEEGENLEQRAAAGAATTGAAAAGAVTGDATAGAATGGREDKAEGMVV